MKILLLSLFLIIPYSSYACWDDYEDDWWYDDSWCDDEDDWWYDDSDDDIGWEKELPGIDVTPDEDYEWESDDDWWRNEQEDDEDTDDDSQYWDDSQDEDNENSTHTGDGYETIVGAGRDYQKYTIKYNDNIIDNVKDKIWVKQSSLMSCVVTAMEYVAQILNNNNLNYRITFESDYIFSVNPLNTDIDVNGIYLEDLDKFMNLEFNMEQITSQILFNQSIDNGWPIINILSSEPLNPWDPVSHMIVVVGQTADENYYIYLDPADGNYKTISYFSINKGYCYSIKSLKKY